MTRIYVRTPPEGSNAADRVARGRSSRHGGSVRGERHHKAKLTEELVRVIRGRADAGEVQATIARDLDVSQHVVSRVVRRQTWAHVT